MLCWRLNRFLQVTDRKMKRRESRLKKELYNSVDARLLSFCGDLVKTRVSDGILMLINYNGKMRSVLGRR